MMTADGEIAMVNAITAEARLGLLAAAKYRSTIEP
jgi:hypothetical protein